MSVRVVKAPEKSLSDLSSRARSNQAAAAKSIVKIKQRRAVEAP